MRRPALPSFRFLSPSCGFSHCRRWCVPSLVRRLWCRWFILNKLLLQKRPPPLCHPRSRFSPLPLCGAYPFVGYCGSFLNKLLSPKRADLANELSLNPGELMPHVAGSRVGVCPRRALSLCGMSADFLCLFARSARVDERTRDERRRHEARCAPRSGQRHVRAPAVAGNPLAPAAHPCLRRPLCW